MIPGLIKTGFILNVRPDSGDGKTRTGVAAFRKWYVGSFDHHYSAEPPHRMSAPQPHDQIRVLVDALSNVIRGNRESIEVLVLSLLSNGSVLMQDVPGVGKTTLAKSVAKAV